MAPQSLRLFDLTCRSRFSWVAICLAFCFLPITASAQNIQKRAGVKVVGDGVGTASLSEDCPDQHGIITAFSVPVQQPGGGPIHIVIFINRPAPPPDGYYFKVVVEDPTIAAVGDPQQGLLALVHIPAGQMESKPYDLYGSKVGKTIIDVLPQTQDVPPWTVPTAVWDINPTADPEVGKWLDANPNDLLTCRDPGKPDMSTDPNRL